MDLLHIQLRYYLPTVLTAYPNLVTMTNWHSPSVLNAENSLSPLSAKTLVLVIQSHLTVALVKLIHVLGGLYMYPIIFFLSDKLFSNSVVPNSY